MSAVYEIPPKRRRIVTRDEVEAAEADADLIDFLVELIETDDRARAAILAVIAGTPKPPARQKRPTTMTPMRRGRGR